MSSLESCISVKFSLKHCNKKSDFLFPLVFLEKIIFCPMQPPSTCVVKHIMCRILFPGKYVSFNNCIKNANMEFFMTASIFSYFCFSDHVISDYVL